MIDQHQSYSKQCELQKVYFPSLIHIQIRQVICRWAHGVEKIRGMSGSCKNTVYPDGTYTQKTDQPHIDFQVPHRIGDLMCLNLIDCINDDHGMVQEKLIRYRAGEAYAAVRKKNRKGSADGHAHTHKAVHVCFPLFIFTEKQIERD